MTILHPQSLRKREEEHNWSCFHFPTFWTVRVWNHGVGLLIVLCRFQRWLCAGILWGAGSGGTLGLFGSSGPYGQANSCSTTQDSYRLQDRDVCARRVRHSPVLDGVATRHNGQLDDPMLSCHASSFKSQAFLVDSDPLTWTWAMSSY